jgi:hypothetical protein
MELSRVNDEFHSKAYTHRVGFLLAVNVIEGDTDRNTPMPNRVAAYSTSTTLCELSAVVSAFYASTTTTT